MNHQIVRLNEASEQLGIPEGTLRYWRHTGSGPRSFKLGNRIAYRQEDLDAWIQSQYETTASA